MTLEDDVVARHLRAYYEQLGFEDVVVTRYPDDCYGIEATWPHDFVTGGGAVDEPGPPNPPEAPDLP